MKQEKQVTALKKNIFTVLFAVILLSACDQPPEPPQKQTIPSFRTESAPVELSEENISSQVTSSYEAQSTAAISESTVSSQTQPTTTYTSTQKSETTVGKLPETDESSAQTSEIITVEPLSELAAEATELSSEELTSRPLSSEAVLETQTVASPVIPAEIVIPEIYEGNFCGEKTLENELACADISDCSKGVIFVSYKGVCEKVKVRITKGDSIYDYTLDSGGSVFPLQSGSGEYNIKVLENVTGKTYAIALDMSFSADIQDPLSPYLIPSQYISFKASDKCVYKAAELCAGKSNAIEKAAAIFDYITENIAYDKELASSVQSGYIPSPDLTLEKGTGICFDYASLFGAMCRSQGIPTRLVMGYVGNGVYHAWNEIYIEETGWITADLFLDIKGWNLVDPTFYASADSKDEVSEFIGNGANYSSVYYY